MAKEDYRRYFEILEILPNASLPEVRNAYLHLKELYSKDSIVTSPIVDEFSSDSMNDILSQIEDAYCNLVAYFEGEKITEEEKTKTVAPSGDDVRREISKISSFSGPVLKQIREKLRVELYEIALSTNIRMKYLEDIEREKFDAVPPEVYLRGFVADFARHLQLDQKKVVNDYMARYREWKKSAGK